MDTSLQSNQKEDLTQSKNTSVEVTNGKVIQFKD